MKDTLRPSISKFNLASKDDENAFIAKASTALGNSKEGLKIISVNLQLETTIVKQLKLLAIEQGTTQRALITEGVKDLLIKYNGK